MDLERTMPKGGATPAGDRLMLESSDERVERHAIGDAAARRHAAGDRAKRLEMRAAHLQHAMNNRLSALLAEEQLLAYGNSLSEEQHEAMERMIELTRRMIDLVRAMDDLRGSQPAR